MALRQGDQPYGGVPGSISALGFNLAFIAARDARALAVELAAEVVVVGGWISDGRAQRSAAAASLQAETDPTTARATATAMSGLDRNISAWSATLAATKVSLVNAQADLALKQAALDAIIDRL